MFTDSIEAVYKMQQNKNLCAVNPEKPYTKNEKVFLFRKDQQQLRQIFNQWFKRNNDL